MSAWTFQLPSGCFFHTATYLPWSVEELPGTLVVNPRLGSRSTIGLPGFLCARRIPFIQSGHLFGEIVAVAGIETGFHLQAFDGFQTADIFGGECLIAHRA